MKILLVEDEIKALEALTQGLQDLEWEVTAVHNGLEGKISIDQEDFDIVVTDIMMPKMSGFELIQYIREKNNVVPILALTALNDTENKVKGLDLGADDYLEKPFEFKELTARIRALYRRTKGRKQFNKLEYADISFDLNRSTVKRSGQDINLTPKELALVKYFIENKERVIPKREIAEKVWGIDFDTQTNIIEVYINYLRNKIDKPFNTTLIHTVHGRGYILKK